MIGYTWIREKAWSDINQKLTRLNSDISEATEFVREIERGNLDVSIGANATDSELKTSLVNMRDQMKKYALTEKQRNWVNEGLAKFVQILRSTNNDTRQSLSDDIVRNLVIYLKANQGALFAINDDDPKDLHLEMEACYAYDRKKFLGKRIEPGEGLAGQVMLEKSTIYMTDVPKDFVKITSGLGEALPRNILVVPLKLDEKVYGVVEIASFQLFEPYEIEFVERLGESIASTIATVKNNDRTTTLLKETQIQAEQLKAQEEEVRQNLEELSATQESMQRAMKEIEGKEAYISQVLNTSKDLIYTVDPDFRIVMWNRPFAMQAEVIGVRLEKGMNAFEWSAEDRKKLVPLYSRVFKGDTFEINYEIEMGGRKYYFLAVYAPLRSSSGEIIEAGIYSRDVTPMVEAQEESARLLKEAQQQGEQLKAQEEELRQNMEELSATQEAIQRTMTEVEGKEAYMSQILNTSQDVIYTVDREFRMMTWNSVFTREAERMNIRVEKGMNAFEWTPDERKKLVVLYARVFKGETFEMNYDIDLGGTRYYFLTVYAPLRSPSGEVVEAAIYARNVTLVVEAQQESARLLKEAQEQSEQLKAQEEELRQNMEELAATQESVEQKAREAEAREEYMSGLLNVSHDLIFSVDREFKLVLWNDSFGRSVKALGVQPEKGMIAFGWRSAPERQHFVKQFERVFNGETFEIIVESKYDGRTHYFLSSFAPLRNTSGEIIEAAVFGRDITAAKEAQLQSEKLLQESQQQAEELKAQEEELRQNMEELQSIQDDLSRKNNEIEKIRILERDRTEALTQSHKKNMLNVTTRFRQLESEYKKKIALLESYRSAVNGNSKSKS